HLLATAKDGRAHLNAYLDDYAFLIDGALELLQARWRGDDFEFALTLARVLLERFEDKNAGGLYFTSDDHEQLLHRPKPTADEALPSGNGIAAQVLLHLGHLLGDTEFLRAAERTLHALQPRIAQYPSAHASLLIALDSYLQPAPTLVLRGAPAQLAEWQAHVARARVIDIATFAIPADAPALPGVLAERKNVPE